MNYLDIDLEEIVGGGAGEKYKVIPGEGGWAIGSPENRTVYGPDISPEQKKKFNDEIKAWVDKSSERKRAIAKAKFRRFISNQKQKIKQL